ncbi:ANTAR domain-containing protein [Lentzea sp. NPDC060358]|uniref:ANTAR domain-containing protein n=1 Tax=Lentzea sp. NPDC060358 TaxID=3347103 RepID=UPI0036699924
MTIDPAQVGDALVLALPGSVGDVRSALLAKALVAAVVPSAVLIVLDVRGVDIMSVQTARTLVAFADGYAERGVACAVVHDPASTSASVVLDVVDPNGAVPRFTALEQALAGRRGGDLPAPRGQASVVTRSTFFAGGHEDVEAVLGTSYASMRIVGAEGRPQVHLTRLATAELCVDDLDVRAGFGFDAGPVGRICLVDLRSGTVEDHLVAGQKEPQAFGPGDLFSLAPPDLPVTGRVSAARAVVTLVTPELFSQVVGPGREVRLLSHRPFDDAASGRLRAAITHVRDTVLAAPEADSLLVSTACRYLAASVLRAFPNTALSPLTATDDNDAHLRTLRRAMAFIESNADRDIGAADIAVAASVTVRSVQLAFRRHLGMTPIAYLRRVRLDAARTELQASDPAGTTVTRIGTRWGFGSASTFAAQYRGAYGESPSQTLREDTGFVRISATSDFAPAGIAPPARTGALDDEPSTTTSGRHGIARTENADDVADAEVVHFEELTRRLLHTSTVAGALQQVVEAVGTVVPGADMVSVTVRTPDGTFHTPVQTDDVAAELDQVQYRSGRGPCLDAARTESPGYVESRDLTDEARWPEFATAATGHGFRAILSSELLPAGGRNQLSGALNIYSRHANGLDAADRHAALLLATHGSLALAHARATELADLTQIQLRRAIDSRDVIGQAKGILMQRQGIGAAEAFDLLRRTSQQLNVKLVDLAGTLTARHTELDQL